MAAERSIVSSCRPLANLAFLGYTPPTILNVCQRYFFQMNSTSSVVETYTCCDVLVIGGGPAGSTISALLAEQGWNVHVLEKDTHPRFHIGESLLPQSVPMLQRLGVLPD